MLCGYIVVITRNGSLGGRYPLTATECLFGQSPTCDVRVYVANVARKHCLITASPNEKAYIRNLSASNTTLVNGIQIGVNQHELQHADVITIGDRHFRWEYPITSNLKTPSKKTVNSELLKTPTCMVQVPMSVLKRKRHSTPGILRENKIISVTSQGGVEPDPKRRKTLHNLKDLITENKLTKPVSKQMKAVTQPAGSPKSFNTFRVLLKAVSKKKSMIRLSKTPKPEKKVISTKVHRSKSLSPSKISPKNKIPVKDPKKILSENSGRVKKTIKMSPPLKQTARKLSISIPSRKTISIATKNSPQKNSPIPQRISGKASPKSPKNDSQVKSVGKVTPRKRLSSSASQGRSPLMGKIPRGRPSKIPVTTLSKKSTIPRKSPLSKPATSNKSSPKRFSSASKTHRTGTKTNQDSTSLKKTPTLKPPLKKSQNEAGTPVKTPRGSPKKTPETTSLRPTIAPDESSLKGSIDLNVSNTFVDKTPNTSCVTVVITSTSPSCNSKLSLKSTSEGEKTPGKIPRGRTQKTPEISPARKALSFEEISSSIPNTTVSPSTVVQPGYSQTPKDTTPKTPRSLSTPVLKTPGVNSSERETPSKTARGRPRKTPLITSNRQTPSLVEMSSSRSTTASFSSVVERAITPKGRSPKTPRSLNTPVLKSPGLSSPERETPGKADRGRPRKTPLITPARKTPLLIEMSSSRSTTNSPSSVVKRATTPKDGPPKTPRSLSTPVLKSPGLSSPERETPGKAARGRPRKTPLITPARQTPLLIEMSSYRSTTASPSSVVEPATTPKDGTQKTPQSLSTPVLKSPGLNSPERETPGKAARGRPRKTPRSLSPPVLKSPGLSSPERETPGKAARGRPRKTPRSLSTPVLKSPGLSSPERETPGKAARGRPRKTPLITPARQTPLLIEMSSYRSTTASPSSVVEPATTPKDGTPKTPRSLSTPVLKSPGLSSPERETPGKAARGRPRKTPRSLSPPVLKSPGLSSPERETPGKAARGRPPKTPRSLSIPVLKSPGLSSPERETPGKAARGRPRKTPLITSTRQTLNQTQPLLVEMSPSRSPTTVSSLTVVELSATPKGRTPQTPRSLSAPNPKLGGLVLLERDDTLSKKSRGRPPKISEISTVRKTISLGELSSSKPSRITEVSLLKIINTPISRSPKTSFATAAIKRLSPGRKSSANRSSQEITLVEDVTSSKSHRGRPRKMSQSINAGNETFQEESTSPKVSNTVNSPEIDEIPGRLSKSRLSNTPKCSLPKNSKESSPDQSSNSVKYNETPQKSARKSALKSGLSSLRRSTPLSNPVVVKSSSKKAEIVKLQIDSKRKYDTDAEAKAERAAKRLKMETPKSLTKNKKAALWMCHSPKSQKRPLFSEVLKSHLSTVKKRQATTAQTVVDRKTVRPILHKQPISLEVPKTFKFNSTGHANSPETIVIRKAIKKTITPKSQNSYLKSPSMIVENKDLSSVPEYSKTPKSIISSLKSASSLKKSQNIRVRFSLKNDVQSPSGRRSVVAHNDEVTYIGSPMVPSRKYTVTPRSSMRKVSDASLMHTSIMEESPLAQEINTSEIVTSPKMATDKSYDFSIYSPSSPTLHFSRISGVSSVFARRSIDFVDSPVSENSQGLPKSKRLSRAENDIDESIVNFSVSENIEDSSRGRQLSKMMDSLLSESSLINSPDSRIGKKQPQRKRSSRIVSNSFSESSFMNSPMSVSTKESPKSNRLSKKVKDSLSESSASLSKSALFASVSCNKIKHSEFQPSPDSYAVFSHSDRNDVSRVSEIPLPDSPPKGKKSPSSASSMLTKSIRSTRSNNSSIISTTSSVVENSPSKSMLSMNSTLSSMSSENLSPVEKSNTYFDLSSLSSSTASKITKKISSTPKLLCDSSLYSPISSPITVPHQRSLRSLSFLSSPNFSEESSRTAAKTDTEVFKTPLPTPSKKTRKSSNRTNVSQAETPLSESQVPVATVKPSTRRRQGKEESYSSASESISLPSLSVSHDISSRSIDRSFGQKMLASRASHDLDHSRSSRSSSPSVAYDHSNFSLHSMSSGRRKRKSSANTSMQSIDATTFDFTSAKTPKIPREMFVSPLDKISDDLTNISGVNKILSPKGNSPISSYDDVRGVKKLFKTEKVQNNLTDVAGVKRIMSPKANSPISSYIDVKGVKRLLRTPQSNSPLANYACVEGIKDLFKHSPVADYTNVVGVKNLYSASVEPNYINVRGVRRIFKETKVPNSPDIAGVEVLFESPQKLMDEYNQYPLSKPIGMVPPMSRDVLDMISEDSTTEDINPESNKSTSRNAESGPSSRRRTLVSKPVDDGQLLSNKSSDSKKNKQTNKGIQIASNPETQEQAQVRVTRRKRGQPSPLNHIEEQVDQPKNKIVDEDVASRIQTNTGRRTRRNISPSQAEILKLSEKESINLKSKRKLVGNKENREFETSSSNTSNRKEDSKTSKELTHLEPANVPIQPGNTKQPRKRGRPAKLKDQGANSNSPKEELEDRNLNLRRRKDGEGSATQMPVVGKPKKLEDVSSNLKLIQRVPLTSPLENKKTRRRVQFDILSTPSQKTSGRKKKTVSKALEDEAKSDIKMTSPTKTQRKTRHTKKVNDEETAAIMTSPTKTERKTRRTKKVNDEETAAMTEPTSSDISPKRKQPAKKGAFKTKASPKLKAAAKAIAAAPVDITPEKKEVPPKRKTRRAKTSPEPVATDTFQAPVPVHTTTEKKEPIKRKTRKAITSLEPEPVTTTDTFQAPVPVHTTTEKKEPIKRKTRKAITSLEPEPVTTTAKAEATVDITSEKEEPAKRKVRRGRTSPELEPVKTSKPTTLGISPKRRQPANKVASKTKASPKLKAAAKAKSAAPVHNTPKKEKEPTKRKTRRAKTSPEPVATIESPSPKVSKTKESKTKTAAKEVSSKLKSSSKVKATKKRKSSLPEKSPPAKRATRSRK